MNVFKNLYLTKVMALLVAGSVLGTTIGCTSSGTSNSANSSSTYQNLIEITKKQISLCNDKKKSIVITNKTMSELSLSLENNDKDGYLAYFLDTDNNKTTTITSSEYKIPLYIKAINLQPEQNPILKINVKNNKGVEQVLEATVQLEDDTELCSTNEIDKIKTPTVTTETKSSDERVSTTESITNSTDETLSTNLGEEVGDSSKVVNGLKDEVVRTNSKVTLNTDEVIKTNDVVVNNNTKDEVVTTNDTTATKAEYIVIDGTKYSTVGDPDYEPSATKTAAVVNGMERGKDENVVTTTANKINNQAEEIRSNLLKEFYEQYKTEIYVTAGVGVGIGSAFWIKQRKKKKNVVGVAPAAVVAAVAKNEKEEAEERLRELLKEQRIRCKKMDAHIASGNAHDMRNIIQSLSFDIFNFLNKKKQREINHAVAEKIIKVYNIYNKTRKRYRPRGIWQIIQSLLENVLEPNNVNALNALAELDSYIPWQTLDRINIQDYAQILYQAIIANNERLYLIDPNIDWDQQFIDDHTKEAIKVANPFYQLLTLKGNLA